MTIREIYTAAANHFRVPVRDEEFLRGVPTFHGLRGPDDMRVTVDSELDDAGAELVTRWAVEQTAYQAGIRQGIIGHLTRKEARKRGMWGDRLVYDPDTRAAYRAAIAAGIAAVSTPRHTGGTMTTTTPEIDPDDTNNLGLPVIDDEVRLTDGSKARVLQRYDPSLSRVMTGKDDAWQVTGPTGARVITLADIAGYVADEAPEIPEVDHAAALVLNAALDWERACQRGSGDLATPADELHKAIRAWAPLVTE